MAASVEQSASEGVPWAYGGAPGPRGGEQRPVDGDAGMSDGCPMLDLCDVVLGPGRDRSVRRRHPWLLSGAVARVEGDPAAGAQVRVRSSEGEVVGFGHWSPHSQIRVRLLTFGKEPPEEDLLGRRVAAAVGRRAADGLLGETDGLRLVHAEADGLPGLIVDRYADTLVVKLASAGMASRREELSAALRAATGAACGFERADSTAARREGMAARQGPLWGDAPVQPVWIRERERRYAVDVVNGQKTGFYLDQREARDRVQAFAAERKVLDLYSYSGAFAVAAALGGAAHVTLVESSAEALALAETNLEANAPGVPRRLVRAEVARFLRSDAEEYDLIVLDPPPLARRRAEAERAARACTSVLAGALRCARPGALVLAFSCSHHLDLSRLRRVAYAAALEAGSRAELLEVLGAPVDHPVALDHPEGEYLKGLLLRVSR